MTTTTLKDLRKHDACISGYNKLACHVTDQPFNEGRETYVRIRHDEPITLAIILESNGLDDALWALRACKQTPEMVRAERLFGVWCARQVQHLMTDPRSVAALDVAERHADCLATDSELYAACYAARNAAWDAAVAAAMDAAWEAARDAARDAASDAAWDAARAAASDAAWDDARAAAWDAACASQKAKFIEVFCGESINVDCLRAKEIA